LLHYQRDPASKPLVTPPVNRRVEASLKDEALCAPGLGLSGHIISLCKLGCYAPSLQCEAVLMRREVGRDWTRCVNRESYSGNVTLTRDATCSTRLLMKVLQPQRSYLIALRCSQTSYILLHNMAPAGIQPASRQKRIQKANVAKRGLTGRRPLIEDSDEDELSQPDWEFVFEEEDGENDKEAADEDAFSKARRRTSRQVAKGSTNFNKKIITARKGQFECTVGDCVMVLHGEDSYEAWSGIIKSFELDKFHPDGEPMRATIKWFANPSEVHVSKRRNDVLEVSQKFKELWHIADCL
jgi:hypothetical protein